MDRWLTINEPKVIVQQGYQLGWMAPGKRDDVAAGRVLHHLNLAHGMAVKAFRASRRTGKIGPSAVVSPCYPFDDLAKQAATVADIRENTLYLQPLLKGSYPDVRQALPPAMARSLAGAVRPGDLQLIAQRPDFIGVNYYSPTIVDQTGEPLKQYPVSSAQWQQIHPGGLLDALTDLHRRYGLDLVIAENGLPDEPGEAPDADETRIKFLRDHLTAVHTAIDRGVPVRAFHAWSFLDNFEWARGYTQRWGLVHVDFPTQARTPKKSARWYSDVARTRSVATS